MSKFFELAVEIAYALALGDEDEATMLFCEYARGHGAVVVILVESLRKLSIQALGTL